jgi:L-ascorbate metabolism protein UlaG (beta-lactamase superfamily)
MEIRWLGQSSFEIKTATGTVVTDPYPGYFDSGAPADPNTIVTLSRRADASGDWPASVKVFDRPGEYETGGLSFRGVATPAADGRAGRTVNTVFVFDAEGMTICAFGQPGVVPDEHTLQMIGPVDALLVRTDGQGLPMEQRAAAARAVEPKVVVPNGFDASSGAPAQALAKFLAQLGVKQAEAQPRLSLNKASLSEGMKTVVLSPRS